MDDTLYPERDFVLSGFRAVSDWVERTLGIPSDQSYAELKSLSEKGVRGDTFDRWLALHELPSADLEAQMVRIYRDHLPSLTPFPQVPELLDSLGRRYRLGLLSDGYLAVQRRKLDALGLSHHFDAIVFSDEWGREAWKPSPKPYLIALQRLAADAARSVYVADNATKDFLGTRRLGIFGIWVRRSNGVYAHLEPPTPQHMPDLTITSLVKLEQILDSGRP